MTVCIAAICEEGKYIVVATDRMFTSPLGVEFETDEPKIEKLGDSCVALAAGSSASSAEIIGATLTSLGGKSQFPVQEAIAQAKSAYTQWRNRKVEENIVIPMLGQDFINARGKNFTLPSYLQPQPNIYQQINALSIEHNINLELLVVGIDETGAHIYQVTHPGTEYSLDKLGHAAVGSGAHHVIIYFSLVAQTSHKGLIETLFTVYDAKKSAEVAPGVGHDTDMAIVERDKIWNCPTELLDALEDISVASRTRDLPDLSEVQKAYEEQHS